MRSQWSSPVNAISSIDRTGYLNVNDFGELLLGADDRSSAPILRKEFVLKKSRRKILIVVGIIIVALVGSAAIAAATMNTADQEDNEIFKLIGKADGIFINDYDWEVRGFLEEYAHKNMIELTLCKRVGKFLVEENTVFVPSSFNIKGKLFEMGFEHAASYWKDHELWERKKQQQ
jgi:hypothetical protein